MSNVNVTVSSIFISALLAVASSAAAQYRVECKSGKATAWNENGRALNGVVTDAVCAADRGHDMVQIAVDINKEAVWRRATGTVQSTPVGVSVTPKPQFSSNPSCEGFADSHPAACKTMNVPVPVPPDRIYKVEFRAHQNKSGDNHYCFDGRVTRDATKKWVMQFTGSDGKPYPVQTGLMCAIGWSGFENVRVEESNSSRAAVVGTFKNWSLDEDNRTGVIVVWYVRPSAK